MDEIREVLERQKEEIKKLYYDIGFADGIANFLLLACDEVDDETRKKLIEMAEMLKKEI